MGVISLGHLRGECAHRSSGRHASDRVQIRGADSLGEYPKQALYARLNAASEA